MRTHNLLPVVYDELRVLARRFLANERVGHTLQPTALVHEVYLRLSAQEKDTWDSRRQFFIAAAVMIRRILVNHEREIGFFQRDIIHKFSVSRSRIFPDHSA